MKPKSILQHPPHTDRFTITVQVDAGTSSDLDEVVEYVHHLLQGLLQVLAEGEVLRVLADLLHAPALGLLSGLLCPVLVIIIPILQRERERERLDVLTRGWGNYTYYTTITV